MPRQVEAQRRYRGESAEQRRAGRRSRFVEAAIEQVGRHGYRDTPIRAVCREAGLNERYFYEAFSGREAMLAAAYEEVIRRVSRAVIAAVTDPAQSPRTRIRAGFEAFVGTLAADRRLARIQLFEIVGVSAELDARRRDVMAMFAGLIRSVSLELDPSLEQLPSPVTDSAADMVVGGVHELVVQWIQGESALSQEELVDGMTAVSLALVSGLGAGRPR